MGNRGRLHDAGTPVVRRVVHELPGVGDVLARVPGPAPAGDGAESLHRALLPRRGDRAGRRPSPLRGMPPGLISGASGRRGSAATRSGSVDERCAHGERSTGSSIATGSPPTAGRSPSARISPRFRTACSLWGRMPAKRCCSRVGTAHGRPAGYGAPRPRPRAPAGHGADPPLHRRGHRRGLHAGRAPDGGRHHRVARPDRSGRSWRPGSTAGFKAGRRPAGTSMGPRSSRRAERVYGGLGLELSRNGRRDFAAVDRWDRLLGPNSPFRLSLAWLASAIPVAGASAAW